YFSGPNLKVDVAQDFALLVAIGFVGKSDVVKVNAACKGRQRLRAALFANIVFGIHELEDFRRCAQRLLKIVVEQGELANRIVETEYGGDECGKFSQGEFVVHDFLAAEKQHQGNGNRAKNIHERRTDGCCCDGTQVGPKQALCRAAEAGNLPGLHTEGLHNAVAGNSFLKDVLDVGQLVLALASGMPDLPADLCR